MKQEPAIVATGFHVPELAVKAGEDGFGALPGEVEEISVAAFDEDATTMAVEAARWALQSAGVEGRDVAVLMVACRGGMDQDVLLAALGLEDVAAETLEGDAGELMVPEALSRSEEAALTLAIASHVPEYGGDPLERGLGAGAAAFVLARGEGARLVASASGDAGETPAPGLARITGDLGVASVPLDLVEALARSRKDQTIAMVFGQEESGGALTFAVDAPPRGPGEVSREVLARRKYLDRESYDALRDQRADPATTTSMGAYVSPAAYAEHLDARYRLMGWRCADCGVMAFNPREACIPCGSTDLEDVPLKPTGSVYSVTVIGQGGAPTEFAPLQAAMGPYGVAVVQLDDGPRLTAMLTDCDPHTVTIGDPVRAAFRRIYTQDGATRYGMKFRPRRGNAGRATGERSTSPPA